MLARIKGIAINTFRESIRDKVLLTLVVFALVVLGSARVIQPLSLGEEGKVIRDIGLGSITFFCVLIAILVGGRLVYKEVEKRTIYVMLAKPVRRWEFIVGKYLGLLLVLLASLAIMTAGFYLVLLLLGLSAPAQMLWAVFMTFLELVILTATAILFSTFVTPISGAVFTFAVYFVGHSTRDLRLLAAMSPSPVVKIVSYLFYYALPNFNNFNIRGEVAHGVPLDPDSILLASVYALVYAATLMLVSVAAFQRKEF